MIFKIDEAFQKIVDERGQKLRRLSFDDLRKFKEPTEHIAIKTRHATISILVESRPNNCLRVVVQGFMPLRLFPSIKSVALDGFYKYQDGTVAPMPPKEFYEFD